VKAATITVPVLVNAEGTEEARTLGIEEPEGEFVDTVLFIDKIEAYHASQKEKGQSAVYMDSSSCITVDARPEEISARIRRARKK
jgi:hypothetical protein